MKKLIVTSLATLACLGAFAQGKLSFATDSIHLVYYDPVNVLPADSALAGTSVFNTAMPAGITLVADLYGGTSAGSLTLISTTVFGAVKGRWTSANTTFNTPALPAGTPAFFQIQIRDQNFATATLASATSYSGFSPIFTATPQVSIFNPIYQHTATVNSTWTDGTFNLDSVGVGSKGAIDVSAPVPEPTSFALAGLGAAALLIFRRRK